MTVRPKNQSEDNLLKYYNKSFEKNNSLTNKIYYTSIVFLNIVTLVLALYYINSKNNIISFDTIWNSLSWKSVLFVFALYFVIVLLCVLPVYLNFYSLGKKRTFGLSYKSVIFSGFYSRVTFASLGTNYSMVKYINSKTGDSKSSVDVVVAKELFSKIAKFIYSIVFMILGIIIWNSISNQWLIILASIPLVGYGLFFIYLILFVHKKEFALSLLSKLSKFLFNIKLIKSYEDFYELCLSKMIIYLKVLKGNKLMILLQIIVYMIVIFLKTSLVYYLIVSLNLGDANMLGEIIFAYVIMQLIFSIWILPKGTLIYEILFMILFKNILFVGFEFWAIMFVRLFDYFICVLEYLIVVLIDYLLKKKNTQKVSL